MLGTPVLLTLATTLANPPSSKRPPSDFTSSQVNNHLGNNKDKDKDKEKDKDKDKYKDKRQD